MAEKNRVESILIVEDDGDIAAVISTNMQDLGYQTHWEKTGPAGLERALAESFAVIILDLMLPGMDGLSLCKHFREQNKETPILMLTARAEEIDRVLGLELGADDYMTKPFSVRELNARVKALIRRSRLNRHESSEGNPAKLKIGQLEVDTALRSVRLKGNLLELTVKEFDLLVLFMHNPGRAFSRSDLLNLVWGYQFQGYEHTVNSHINRLRNKIEDDASHPEYLKTIWGIGYRFSEEGEWAS